MGVTGENKGVGGGCKIHLSRIEFSEAAAKGWRRVRDGSEAQRKPS